MKSSAYWDWVVNRCFKGFADLTTLYHITQTVSLIAFVRFH